LKVIIFGATGMIGQSTIRECLLDENIKQIVTIGRNRTGKQHNKLHEIELNDLTNLSSIEYIIKDFDACFFCLGVSSSGMTEAEYTRITYDLTLSVAESLVNINPQLTFIYVSGSGTDSSEKGRSMWARVKGKTENGLLRLPFKAVYMFRPGAIIPLHGVKSKTKWYQLFYAILRPFNPLLLKASIVITSEQLGKAMIKVASNGYSDSILESSQLKLI